MNNGNKVYEMANADKPEEIIQATQTSVLKCLEIAIQNIQNDIKGPGLTWDQIYMVLDIFKKKKPEIIFQDKAQ